MIIVVTYGKSNPEERQEDLSLYQRRREEETDRGRSVKEMRRGKRRGICKRPYDACKIGNDPYFMGGLQKCFAVCPFCVILILENYIIPEGGFIDE